MRVNPTTLLFEDLDQAAALLILQMSEALVLEGEVPYPYPAWLEEWMQAGNFDAGKRLLVISTAFPQRALLSVARFYAQAQLDAQVTP